MKAYPHKLLSSVLLLCQSETSLADEGGTSFWLPGQYASFAAIAPTTEWSLPMQTYSYSGNVHAQRALTRGDQIAFGSNISILAAPTPI